MATAGPLPLQNLSDSNSTGPMDRRCDKSDCNAAKLIAKVHKRNVTNFVKEPKVSDKPLLMSGFTTIFQVEGSPAKFVDLGVIDPSEKPNTVYRIMPNTHAHLLNYVVVEDDGDALAKIQQNDPSTITKLLESQKQSAEQMLKKLITGKYANSVQPPPNESPGPAKIESVPTTLTSAVPPSKLQGASAGKVQSPRSAATNAVAIRKSIVRDIDNVPTPSTDSKLIRKAMMPTKQRKSKMTTVEAASLRSDTPTILKSTQRKKALLGPESTKKGNFIDKMQAELMELRRTVAALAKAQNITNEPVMSPRTSMASQSLPSPSGSIRGPTLSKTGRGRGRGGKRSRPI